MELGNRVIYDQDGEIFFQSGEMEGDILPRKEIVELHWIDLPYGLLGNTHKLVGINVETKEPILESITKQKTEEQIKIEELENLLLITEGVI